MKYSLVAVALAAVVRAQTIDDVPTCAVPCLDEAITSETDCETTDYACVCENFSAIQGTATGCVITECGAETALNEVLPAVEALCANQGEPSSAPTTSAAPTEEPSAEPTEEPTEEPTAAPTTAAPSTTVHEEPTTSNTATVILPPPVDTPAPNATETGSEPSPVPTAGAAVLGSLGALGLAAIGLLAL